MECCARPATLWPLAVRTVHVSSAPVMNVSLVVSCSRGRKHATSAATQKQIVACGARPLAVRYIMCLASFNFTLCAATALSWSSCPHVDSLCWMA